MAGALLFWPGSIVTVNNSVAVDVEESNVVGVGLPGTLCRLRTSARSGARLHRGDIPRVRRA